MNVELFDIRDAPRMAEALAIRFRVFVDEQGVPPEEEVDEHDREDLGACHALVRESGVAVATGRYYSADAATAQIGRMAVDAAWRGRGVGALLLDTLVERATSAGFARARLLAQTQATGFYRRVGFREYGEPVLDGGIPHQPMERHLAAPS